MNNSKNVLRKVTGQECLNYIDKAIAFADKSRYGQSVSFYLQLLDSTDPAHRNWYAPIIKKATGSHADSLEWSWSDAVTITKFDHNINKKIVGYVVEEYDDGGYKVVVLGEEKLDHLYRYDQFIYLNGIQSYSRVSPLELEIKQEPFIGDSAYTSEYTVNQCNTTLRTNYNTEVVPFYDAVDYYLTLEDFGNAQATSGHSALDITHMTDLMLTNDENTTLVFGAGVHYPDLLFDNRAMNNPLEYLQGDLYGLANSRGFDLHGMCPPRFTDSNYLNLFVAYTGDTIQSTNLVAVPYNLVLTRNINYAKAYINDGVLPPDAFLFPLDWDNLPQYDPDNNPDDDTTPDDDPDNDGGFDGDPDLPEAPTYPPSKMSPNNFYWLTVGQLSAFINWFWYDVGEISSFDSLINKIEGLYNDLASAVLMVRFMPAPLINDDPAYCFGGLGTPSTIKVGMVEKSGNVDTIARATPPIIDIGHVTVPKKFKSWASYTPYAHCSLYLPYYGFMDLDMDMFTGHDIYVKAIYDYLSGTIQYLIYYENKYLVNSIVCKMAVDIPITLQSKNDRDSAIFSNVSNSIAGLMGATSTVMGGNPIGLVVGANALNSGVNSAPLSVKGTVGEQGAFYAPNKCKLITQFPVQQKPSKFEQFCGKQYNKTVRLGSDKLYGLTKCHNPRIKFTNSTPLQSEIDEIYSLLEKGVIL